VSNVVVEQDNFGEIVDVEMQPFVVCSGSEEKVVFVLVHLDLDLDQYFDSVTKSDTELAGVFEIDDEIEADKADVVVEVDIADDTSS